MKKLKTIFQNFFPQNTSSQISKSENPDKIFIDALEVFSIELKRIKHQSANELSKSLIRLAESPEFSRTAMPYFLRQKIYQESVEKLGDNFLEILKSIILPHCELISEQQLQLLKEELRKAINANLQQAKSGTTEFAASVGRSDNVKSKIQTFEASYQAISLSFEEKLASTVKQSNLHNAYEKRIKQPEAKQQRSKLQQYQDYFTNHKIFSVLVFIGIVIVYLGTFTDSLHRIFNLFSPIAKDIDEQITIVVDVQNQDSVDIQIDPLCEFQLTEDTGLIINTYSKGRTTLGALKKLELLPDFSIQARSIRTYFIIIPNLPIYHNLLSRGAANIHVIVFKINSREFGIGSLAFQKDYIKKYRGQIVINGK